MNERIVNKIDGYMNTNSYQKALICCEYCYNKVGVDNYFLKKMIEIYVLLEDFKSALKYCNIYLMFYPLDDDVHNKKILCLKKLKKISKLADYLLVINKLGINIHYNIPSFNNN